ncbi:contact-dependent growth inhibition system immunity protein [Bacillus bingmayongensis]|uniref:contact-dependent growth inhibition system immunity protein n=1 Tax=Bacillus bingmayongensis TaxID=1150157 RepID=UPI0002DCDD2A|nr:contact-dependent growth inhibition system immunity protein [Bacillus bingmayongensis]MBY0595210.1 hypothetical protein [Bacillus bingmayongensis]
MMSDKNVIKDIFRINDDFGVNCKYDKKYKEILNKTVDDLTVSDIYFLIRQDILKDLAIKRAIYFIKENPLAGEMYPSQLLEILSENMSDCSNVHRNEFFELEESIQKYIKNITWEDDVEKQDFYDIYKRFKKELEEM